MSMKKSDIDKLTERSLAAERKASEAEARATRYEVALSKGVPTKLMKFLTGSTQEEIEASADELLAAVKPDTGNTDAETSKPKEKLRAGAAGPEADDGDNDPASIAAKIKRAGW